MSELLTSGTPVIGFFVFSGMMNPADVTPPGGGGA
jgi:hypothetical protein